MASLKDNSAGSSSSVSSPTTANKSSSPKIREEQSSSSKTPPPGSKNEVPPAPGAGPEPDEEFQYEDNHVDANDDAYQYPEQDPTGSSAGWEQDASSAEQEYVARPIAMEPYGILEDATHNICYHTDWCGSEMRKAMEQCKVRLQEHIIHRRRQVEDADTDSEDDEGDFYDYRKQLNPHLEERWTKAQQVELEKDMIPVFEFLDSFHLVGQQLEFIATQVHQTAGALAENVTNWCAAEYGWTKHVQTLQLRSYEYRHKQALAVANNNRVKQQMLMLGEDGQKTSSWFSRRGKSLEKLAEAQHKHQQAIADLEEQMESLDAVRAKLLPQVHEDLEQKRRTILESVDDLFLKANFVVGYKTDPKERVASHLKSKDSAIGSAAATPTSTMPSYSVPAAAAPRPAAAGAGTAALAPGAANLNASTNETVGGSSSSTSNAAKKSATSPATTEVVAVPAPEQDVAQKTAATLPPKARDFEPSARRVAPSKGDAGSAAAPPTATVQEPGKAAAAGLLPADASAPLDDKPDEDKRTTTAPPAAAPAAAPSTSSSSTSEEEVVATAAADEPSSTVPGVVNVPKKKNSKGKKKKNGAGTGEHGTTTRIQDAARDPLGG